MPMPHLTFDAQRKCMVANIVTIRKDIEDGILNILDSSDELKIYENSMLVVGNSATTISKQMLMQWLLVHSERCGVDQALDDLAAYLQKDHNPATEVLAITGIEVDTAFELYKGCTLQPFSDLPNSSPKQSLDPEWLRPEVLLQQGLYGFAHDSVYMAPKAALVRNTEIRPKFRLTDSTDNIPAARSTVLTDLCDSLTLVGTGAPLLAGHWHHVDHNIPGAEFIGSSWLSPRHDVLNRETFKISAELVDTAQNIAAGYLSLPESIRVRLRLPIQRLGKARRHRSLVDKAIDLGVALESLYLGDRDEKSEVAYTFRLRAAWHMGVDFEDRKKMLSTFKEIYNVRSRAVHRGELPTAISVPEDGKVPITKFLDSTDALCAAAIRKIIRAGAFPSWGDIVLGQPPH